MNTKDTTRHKAKSRVFLIDDHPVVRAGLGQLINQQPDLMVCCEAATFSEAVDQFGGCRADIAIVDISLDEHIGGFELIRQLRLQCPDFPILVLSIHDEAVFAERALWAGANGYVMKEEATETILAAIHRVLDGGTWLSERMARRLEIGHNENTPNVGGSLPISP